MFRCLAILTLCLGLAAANVIKKNKKLAKKIIKRDGTALCADNEFTCTNQKCIQEEWTCDTDDDCGDRSDEELPECPPAGHCTGLHEIKCDNNNCIPLEFRCDGDDDCDDGTDERRCELYQCYTGEFKCPNGLCIENAWLCDGDNDCKDFTDEENCPSK